MKFVFIPIRWILGRIILVADRLTRPSPPRHSDQLQQELDQKTSAMSLYQFAMCPFCVKTRRAVQRLGLNIEIRDAKNNSEWNRELIEQGGKYQVPCLRLENSDGKIEWMYESTTIIKFLEDRFSSQFTDST